MSNEREHIDEKLTDLERLRAGISKRAYLAAMAMQGLCSRIVEYADVLRGNDKVSAQAVVDQLALDSVRAADALLKALEEKR